MAASTALRQEELEVSLREAHEVLSPQRRSLVVLLIDQLEREIMAKSLLSKGMRDSLSSLRIVCAELEMENDRCALERPRHIVGSLQNMLTIAELHGAVCSLHGDQVGAKRHGRSALQYQLLLTQAREADGACGELKLFA